MSIIKIKPTTTNTKKVDLNCGITALSSTLALGSIFHSQTELMDKESLSDAIEMSQELIQSLHGGISTVSTALAMMDNSEDIKAEINNLMWLISGLSELAGQVHFQSNELQFKLNQKSNTA